MDYIIVRLLQGGRTKPKKADERANDPNRLGYDGIRRNEKIKSHCVVMM